jgi:hypothetical protein
MGAEFGDACGSPGQVILLLLRRGPESSALRQRSFKVRRLQWGMLAFGCIQLNDVSMKKS